jgi:DNA-binding XRE family transcriptional regulator
MLGGTFSTIWTLLGGDSDVTARTRSGLDVRRARSAIGAGTATNSPKRGTRKMNRPYRADTDRANRLHAARKAAGLKSAREAATKFGWPLKTYQAHEAANLHFDEATGKNYAAAFNVPTGWLYRGEGEGPAVDKAREARFATRRFQAEPPEAGPAGRLRAARRLAGYGSVKAAAAAIGINRTTLSAHEAGQNQITRDTALRYGRAYAVAPDWLISGKLPSGFPPQTDAALQEVMAMHHDSDGRTLARFAHLVRNTLPDFRRPDPTEAAPRSGEPETKAVEGERVREFSPRSLFLRLQGEAGGLSTAAWMFPPGYLSQIYNCDPGMAVFVTVPDRLPGFPEGGRLLIDTGATESVGDARAAVVTYEGRLYLVPLPKHAIFLRTLPPHEKVAGIVAAYFGPPPQ